MHDTIQRPRATLRNAGIVLSLTGLAAAACHVATSSGDVYEIGSAVYTDGDDTYVAGIFAGQASFGPHTVTALGSGWNWYAAKIDDTGSYVWAERVNLPSGSSLSAPRGIAPAKNSDDLYIGGDRWLVRMRRDGTHLNHIDLDANDHLGAHKNCDSVADVATAAENQGVFVACHNTDGNSSVMRAVAYNVADQIVVLDTDIKRVRYHEATDDLYVFGEFEGTINTGSIDYPSVTSQGGRDVFIWRHKGYPLSRRGAIGVGGVHDDYAGGFDIDHNRSFYLTLNVNGNSTIIGYPISYGGTAKLSVAAKLNSAGTTLWTSRYTSTPGFDFEDLDYEDGEVVFCADFRDGFSAIDEQWALGSPGRNVAFVAIDSLDGSHTHSAKTSLGNSTSDAAYCSAVSAGTGALSVAEAVGYYFGDVTFELEPNDITPPTTVGADAFSWRAMQR